MPVEDSDALGDAVIAVLGDDELRARYIEAAFSRADGMVRVASIYLPNGNPAPGPKYDYKLRWFERLHRHAAELLASGEPVVLTGAMRAANHPQADGPDNLRAARDWVAQAPASGVWVVMAGQVRRRACIVARMNAKRAAIDPAAPGNANVAPPEPQASE
mgnify:CR=1 FL=1